jgi:predicted secreted protein
LCEEAAAAAAGVGRQHSSTWPWFGADEAMASHAGNGGSALPAAANVVGNAFVSQYYNVLHQSPLVVHRFYTDASHLTRAEAGPDGVVDTVVTQDEIHKKVMSVDYSDFKAEIKTVDSQESLMGGVLVMVNGSLSSESTGKRNFTQSFFLAPQEKGYFVLNDIFRYLEEPSLVSKPALSLPNDLPETPIAPYVSEPAFDGYVVVDMESREATLSPAAEVEARVEEKVDLSEQLDALEVDEEDLPEDPAQVEIPLPNSEESASLPVQTAPSTASLPAEDDTTSSGEKPKVSYASILRLRNEGGPVPPTSHVVPKATQAPPKVSAVSVHPISSSSAPAAGDAHNTVDENAPPEAEGLFKLLRTVTISNTIFAMWEIMLLEETLVLSTYGENALAMLPFM